MTPSCPRRDASQCPDAKRSLDETPEAMQTRRVQQKLNEVSARDSTDAFDGCCAWRGHDPISRMLTHCSLLFAVTQLKRTRSKRQAAAKSADAVAGPSVNDAAGSSAARYSTPTPSERR